MYRPQSSRSCLRLRLWLLRPISRTLALSPFQALRRDSDPLLAIQSKPQQLAFPDLPRSALSGIHLQAQRLLGLRRCCSHPHIGKSSARASPAPCRAHPGRCSPAAETAGRLAASLPRWLPPTRPPSLPAAGTSPSIATRSKETTTHYPSSALSRTRDRHASASPIRRTVSGGPPTSTHASRLTVRSHFAGRKQVADPCGLDRLQTSVLRTAGFAACGLPG
jgi:hypothetical protein